MNCQECLQALYLYLDRELSDDELDDVDLHLNHCPDCALFFDFKRDVRRLVVRCVTAVEVPASLRAAVERLRTAG